MKIVVILFVCLLGLVPGRSAEVTYYRDVVPVLHQHCNVCHREGDIAPFALDTYERASRKARTILRVCEDGFMPPWIPKEGVGEFLGEKRLPPEKLAILQAWVEQGKLEGDPADTPVLAPLPEAGSWRLGEPDLVLTMDEAFEVPADGPDIYRYFVLPRPKELDKDQVLVAIDFKPGDPSVVHHSDYFIDYEGKARKQKSKDGKPGFSIDETGGFFNYFGGSFLGAWAPGSDPFKLRDGLGIPLPGGGDLVLEIHYHPSGKAAMDQSSIALYFAKKPVERYVNGLFLGTQDVKIPAGEANYWRHFWMELPTGIELLNIAPHMHYVGKEAHVEAILPDGSKKPLLSIEEWDLDWQTAYTYKDPVRLPEGTIIHTRCRFDNSDDNPANPFYPAQTIEWGWGTDQEMCELYLTILTDDETPAGEKALRKAELASWYRSAARGPGGSSGTGARSASDAMNQLIKASAWTSEGESLLTNLLGTETGSQVLDQLRARVKQNPGDVKAQIALGNLAALQSGLGMSNKEVMRLGQEAYDAFERAMKKDKNNWDAWMGMSMVLVYSEYGPWEKEGIKMLNQLIDSQEKYEMEAHYARAYELLAEGYQARGEKSKAADAAKRGLSKFPDDSKLKALAR